MHAYVAKVTIVVCSKAPIAGKLRKLWKTLNEKFHQLRLLCLSNPQKLIGAEVQHVGNINVVNLMSPAFRHVWRDAHRGDGAVRDRLREVLAEQRAGRAHGQGVHGQEVRPRLSRGGGRELRLRDHVRVHHDMLHVLRREPSDLHLEVFVKQCRTFTTIRVVFYGSNNVSLHFLSKWSVWLSFRVRMGHVCLSNLFY